MNLILKNCILFIILLICSCDQIRHQDAHTSEWISDSTYASNKYYDRLIYIASKLNKAGIRFTDYPEKIPAYLHKITYSIDREVGLYEIEVHMEYDSGEFYIIQNNTYALKKMKIIRRLTGNEVYPEDEGHEMLDTVHVNLFESYRFGKQNTLYLDSKLLGKQATEALFQNEKIKRFDDIQLWDSLYDISHKNM